MRLSFAAGLLILLTTASAFGTIQPNYSLSRATTSTTCPAHRRRSPAFVRGGTSSHLQASTLDDTTLVSTENLSLLSERGQRVIKLLEDDKAQRHVVADWPPPGTDDDGKIRLAEQVRSFVSKQYPHTLCINCF